MFFLPSALDGLSITLIPSDRFVPKGDFQDWTTPEEPTVSVAPPGWNWIEILRDYCIHNGQPGPKYTKYIHDRGYRHEVEIAGSMYFGALKHYTGELESQNAAAHMALHSILIQEFGINYSFPGPFILKRYDESLLAQVPQDPEGGQKTEGDNSPFSEEPVIARKRARTTNSPVIRIPRNANAQPLENCRLPPIEVPQEAETSKWKVTPEEISSSLWPLKAHTTKLEKLCDILPLELPEIRVERVDGRLIEADNGEYKVAAYFRDDPFLMRAGAIGKISSITGTKTKAQEACAQKVVDYLIRLVAEDTTMEKQAAKKREAIVRYGENTLETIC